MMRKDQWEFLSPFSDDPSFNSSHLLDTWRHLVETRVFLFVCFFFSSSFSPSFQRVLVLLYLLLNKCSGCSVFVDVYMCFTSILLFICERYSYVLEVTKVWGRMTRFCYCCTGLDWCNIFVWITSVKISHAACIRVQHMINYCINMVYLHSISISF